ELVDPPHAVVLNHLASRIERQAVQPAERTDLIPVLADVTVFQCNMVWPVGAPARPAATWIEALARHHEFGNACDCLADATGFVRGQLAETEAVPLSVITTIEPCQGHAVGVLDHIALGIFPDQGPGRFKAAA